MAIFYYVTCHIWFCYFIMWIKSFDIINFLFNLNFFSLLLLTNQNIQKKSMLHISNTKIKAAEIEIFIFAQFSTSFNNYFFYYPKSKSQQHLINTSINPLFVIDFFQSIWDNVRLKRDELIENYHLKTLMQLLLFVFNWTLKGIVFVVLIIFERVKKEELTMMKSLSIRLECYC